ncbi:MAG: hypothetical protein ACR2RE_13125 [Geminicoccaceae bacterium]
MGSWKGQGASSAIGALPSDALSLEVQRDADGFRISWPDLSTNDQGNSEGNSIDARFLPTGRTGVYEYAPKPGSLLTRMFASPATGNPLRGETLLWARIDGPTLAVYSMKIDPNGGFDLDHYSWTRIENGLQLIFSERTEDLEMQTKLEGELVTRGE